MLLGAMPLSSTNFKTCRRRETLRARDTSRDSTSYVPRYLRARSLFLVRVTTLIINNKIDIQAFMYFMYNTVLLELLYKN